MKHVVIFSHGFGVRQDNRGMFTDIASALPRVTPVMFDYNTCDESANTLTAVELDTQVAKLTSVIAQTRKQYPDGIIDLVCHSQGSVVAALAAPISVRRTILLAPPQDLSVSRIVKVFSRLPGTTFNLDGVSRLPRRDGSTTIVPSSYWKSLASRDPVSLYLAFGCLTELLIITATHDEILGLTDFKRLESVARIQHLEAGHDFRPPARADLVAAVVEYLTA
jgi:pimeloyl-ACP methyl ester carboxylesterase